jgi:hypothetical protein
MFGVGGDIGEQAVRQLGRAERYFDKAADATHAMTFVQRRSRTLTELGITSLERSRPLFEQFGTPADVDLLGSLVGRASTQREIGSITASQLSNGYTTTRKLVADDGALHALADQVHGLRDRAIELRSAGLDDAHRAAAATSFAARAAGGAERADLLVTLDRVDTLVARARSLRTEQEGPVGAIPELLDRATASLREIADAKSLPEQLRGDFDGASVLVHGVTRPETTASELATIESRLSALRSSLTTEPVVVPAAGAAGTTDAALAVDLASVLRRSTRGTQSLLDAAGNLGQVESKSRVVQSARQRLELMREAQGTELGGQAAWRVEDAIDELRRLEVALDPKAKLADPSVASARSAVKAALDGIDTLPTTAESITTDDVVARFRKHVASMTSDVRGSLESAVSNRGSLDPAAARATLATQAADRALRDLLGLTGDVAGADARAAVKDAVAGLGELRRLPVADTEPSRRVSVALEALEKTADEAARGVATDEVINARLVELNAYTGTISVVKPTKVAAEWAVLRAARQPLDEALQQAWNSSGYGLGNPVKAKAALETLDGALEQLRSASKTIRADGAFDAADIADEGIAILDGQRDQLAKYVRFPSEGRLIKHAQFGVANSYLDLAEAVADEFYNVRRATASTI